MKYYLLLNGEIKGPFQILTVREMLNAGAIQELTLMAQEGGSAWKPAGEMLATAAAATKEISSNNVRSQINTLLCKLRQNRNAQVAVVGGGIFLLIVCAILSRNEGGKKNRDVARGEPVRNAESQPARQHGDGGRAAAPSQPERKQGNSTNARRDGMLSDVRRILAQRYSEDAGLRNEIERGVMSLYEVYPDLSAAQLVRKFEVFATGG